MKTKLAKGVGWFGVLTPIFAGGGLLVLWTNGLTPTLPYAGMLAVVCAINFVVGYKLLKRVAVERGR